MPQGVECEDFQFTVNSGLIRDVVHALQGSGCKHRRLISSNELTRQDSLNPSLHDRQAAFKQHRGCSSVWRAALTRGPIPSVAAYRLPMLAPGVAQGDGFLRCR